MVRNSSRRGQDSNIKAFAPRRIYLLIGFIIAILITYILWTHTQDSKFYGWLSSLGTSLTIMISAFLWSSRNKAEEYITPDLLSAEEFNDFNQTVVKDISNRALVLNRTSVVCTLFVSLPSVFYHFDIATNFVIASLAFACLIMTVYCFWIMVYIEQFLKSKRNHIIYEKKRIDEKEKVLAQLADTTNDSILDFQYGSSTVTSKPFI